MVAAYNADPAVHGILVQLPLPAHVDERAVLDAIDLAKDVDGFHPQNIGSLAMRGRAPSFVSCTPKGCMLLLERSGVEISVRALLHRCYRPCVQTSCTQIHGALVGSDCGWTVIYTEEAAQHPASTGERSAGPRSDERRTSYFHCAQYCQVVPHSQGCPGVG